MTVAEVFGAGNCMRDMEFHPLFDRIVVTVGSFSCRSASMFQGKALDSLCIGMTYIPAKYQENTHLANSPTPENLCIAYRT